MSIGSLLQELRKRDVRLWADGDRLRFDAPQGALTDELRNRIASSRAELLDVLSDSRRSGVAVPLGPSPRDDGLPLSFGQQRLWFVDRLEPDSVAYNVPANVRLSGPLDRDLLRRSLEAIAARHETLRTRFPTVDGEARMEILENATVDLIEEDLRSLPQGARFDAGIRRALEEARRPFDLARGPLFRTWLFQVDDDDYVLHVCMHHIISDGWSMGLFFRELAALYRSLAAGEPSGLKPLPLQYVDYAHWQRTMLSGEHLERDLAYWKKQLGEDLPTLALPTDRPRPASQSHRGGAYKLQIDDRVFRALEQLAQRNGATLFMTLLTAYDVLLSRYSGQDDLVVGTPIAGRNRKEVEGLIGFFVNNLVLRVDLSGDPTFLDLLGRVRRVALEAFARPEVPFEKLVEELQPERELGRNPLFQVLFNHFNMTSLYDVRSLGDVKLRSVRSQIPISKFDMTLHCFEDAGRLSARIEYATDLFDTATIARMGRHYVNLLEAVAKGADRPISRLPLMDADERQQVLVEWNATASNADRERCVPQLFEDWARATPDAPALAFEDRTLTFAELEDWSRRVALRLRSLGIGREDLVALYFERSLEMIVALLGVLRSGAAYVPLDPVYPSERVSFMLEDSAAKIILSQTARLSELPSSDAQVLCLDRPEDFDVADGSLPDVSVQDLAYTMYTSGTTGRPKGVELEHGQLLNYIQGVLSRFELPEGSSFGTVSTLAADLGNTSIYGALCSGGCLHVLSEGRIGDGDAFASYMRDHEVDCIKIVPSHLEALLSAAEHPGHVLPRRLLVVGGEASSWQLIDRVRRLAPQCAIVNHYGPTEATVGCLTHRIEAEDHERYPLGPPIGRPIANMRAYLLDSRGEAVPVGAAGELHVGGLGLARGYRNLPEQTSERFAPSRLADGERLYNTGDLARFTPDGELHFLGRADDQVKVRGFRIELGEIQSQLDRHPEVSASAVVVHRADDAPARLVAYVVSPASTSDLRDFLRESLPDYMVPSTFVALERLPLTPNGKLDRRALPPPDLQPSEGEEDWVAPRTPAEKTLAEIWSRVLRIDRVGIHDNFFELGGESILSIQIVSRANQADLRLTPRDLFENPTIASLARVAGKAPAVVAEQETVRGAVPLTPIERRFFDLEPEDPGHYNQSRLLEVKRPLDPEVLEHACAHLIEHHDALRLRLARREGTWSQEIVADAGPVPFTVEDLSALPGDEKFAALADKARVLQASLDLGDGPLLRMALFRMGESVNDRLLIAIHHIAVDGVSWRILLEDLETTCKQIVAGDPVRLPPKTTSFMAWAERLNSYAGTPEALAERDYWAEVARADAPPVPVDQADGEPRLQADAVDVVRSTLTHDETRALLREVGGAYRTQINDVLLTALARAMMSWTSSRRLRVALEGHGREDLFEDVDLSRTVGWFTSVYPVVLEPGEDWPAGSLKTVKEQLRAIPRRGIGWGILRYLGPDDGDLDELRSARAPDVGFNYLGQFDPASDEDRWFASTREAAGSPVSPRNRRHHMLDVTAEVSDGQLSINWVYNTDLHDHVTIEAASDRFVEALREIIKHCVARESTTYTPSDFPLARLNQAELDRIQERYHGMGIEDIYVLSPLQEGMLYHTLMEPESAMYTTQMAFTLLGDLDPRQLKAAWQDTLRRQPVLRTAFVVEGVETLHQVVCRDVELVWSEEDWRAHEGDALEERLGSVADRDRKRGFDFGAPPLMCLRLIRIGGDAFRLIWTHHHVILDGWSLPLLMNGVMQAYANRCAGRAAEPETTRPYSDYVRWLQQQDRSGAEAYWRNRLQGWYEPTPLPMLRQGIPTGVPVTPARASTLLSESATARVAEFARKHHVTLNTLVQGAWSLLLSRYSGTDDVLFGVTVSGRASELPGVEQIMGMFINTLPMRVQTHDQPVVEWLEGIQSQQLEMQQYDYTPLYEVRQWSNVRRATQLFDSILVFENFPAEVQPSLTTSGLRVADARDVSYANYPLAAVVRPGRQLSLELRFDAQRFEEGTVEPLLGHFARLLEQIAESPDRQLNRISMIAPPEKKEWMGAWNDTAREYPSEACVHTLFERQAEQSPDAVAVRYEEHGMTYGELDRRANRLANRLVGHGVGTGTMVAVHADRGVDMIVAILAVLKAGGAYVPLDTGYPKQRLEFMLEDTRAPVLLTQSHLKEQLPAYDGVTLCLDTDWPDIASESDVRPEVITATAESLAYVIYTSGSTGRPKGVSVCHRAINRLVVNTDYIRLGPSDRIAQASNASFDAATFEVWGALLNGAQLIGLGPDVVLSPRRFSVELREQGITVLFITTALFNQLAVEAPGSFAALRYLLFGGEAVDPERVRAALENGPPENLLHVYGPTENTTFSTWYPVREVSEGAVTVPIGRPIANSTCFVLDQALEPSPVGVPGELFVGGDGLAREYLNRPELTAQRFVDLDTAGPRPVRAYRTGDLVRRLPSGDIEFIGRNDNQVKLRGFRIELGEIEAALVQRPEVRDAVVLCLDDSQGDKQLVAYVVSSTAQEPSRVDLRAGLGETMPEYMVPSVFVFLDSLPITPNGKVDRRALPAPTAVRSSEETYVAPRSEIEETIAAIWRDVLGVETVGIRDNFFDLGGHSLRLLRVHQRLVDEIGRDLPMTELFQYPTVEELAKHLSGERDESPGLHTGAQARLARRGTDGGNEIAVIAMAGRFPGAPDVETFWENLVNGVESVRFFSDEELREAGVSETSLRDPRYVKARAVLDDVELFDARFFGYSPRDAELMDPQQRVFLECAWEVLERAGYDSERFDGMIAVYAGMSMSSYLWNLVSHPGLLASAGGMQAQMAVDKDYLATRVSYDLNLRGPSMTVQTACSTGLVAVHQACRSLQDRQCDIALAGGVSIAVPVLNGYMYERSGIRSSDGHNRTFDARAEGTVTGSGSAVVALKRLEGALADGDQIHAVIRGTAVNNDGSAKVGYTAPSVEGQAEAIALAQVTAGVHPDTISYVEAHGTATALGDPIEVAALTKVFRERTTSRGFCGLGSLKSNMGHLNEAAGVSGLIKTVLAMKHGQLPPSLHYESPNPNIDFDDSPFYVVSSLQDWETSPGVPRRAGVSSFGLGGTNAHAIVEETPALDASGPSRRWQVLVLSAKSREALDEASVRLADHLQHNADVNLADVAYTLQVGRRQFEHRRAVLCRDVAEAVRALSGDAADRVWTTQSPERAPAVAFMFPGHGHQHIEMGRGLYETEDVFRDTVDEGLEYLRDQIDFDLRGFLFPASIEPEASAAFLGRPTIFQPAVFLIDYAMAKLWQSWGIEPEVCIGHSLGEYVAACVSGVFRYEDALRIVALRGRLMEKTPAGTMLSIPLPVSRVDALLREEEGIWLSAVNAPELCLVSGEPGRVEAFEERLMRDGHECSRVSATHAYHSGLMESGVGPLIEAVRKVKLNAPRLPFVSNLTGDWIRDSEATDPGYWGLHLREPVRFSEGMDRVLRKSDHVLLEVGPGQIIGSLARMHEACDPGRVLLSSMRHPKTEIADAAVLMSALARLWTAGVSVDWSAFYRDERRRRVLLPTYPFQRERYWIERRSAKDTGKSGWLARRKTSITDWFYSPVWRRTALPEHRPDTEDMADQPKRCLAFVDESEVARSVVGNLENLGWTVLRVECGTAYYRQDNRFTVEPTSPEHYHRLVRELQADSGVPDLVAHLWLVSPESGRHREDDAVAEDLQHRGFFSLFNLMRALGGDGESKPMRIVVVTEGIHDVTGDETICPEKATIIGPCRTIPFEFANVTCRNIDLCGADVERRATTHADRVVRELLSSASDPVVAYRDDRRWVEAFAPVRLPHLAEDAPPQLRKGGTYLISAGLTGVGLVVARYLAESVQANLVLVGRTPLPDRVNWTGYLETNGAKNPVSRRILAVQSLEKAGASVMPAEASIADLDRMQAVVAEAERQFGPVHGVVHSAGVFAGGLMMQQDADKPWEGFEPKVKGTRVLERIFASRELDFMVLCSSFNSTKGFPGTVDYCAANAFIDAFARRYRDDRQVRCVAINWNRWREVGMVVEAVGSVLPEEQGISNAEGTEAFRRVLAHDTGPRIIVSEYDLADVLSSVAASDAGEEQPARSTEDRAEESESEPIAAHDRPALSTEYVAPTTETEHAMVEIWQSAFGIDRIGVRDNFFDLGGHSLLAVRVVNRISEVFSDVGVALHMVFDHPTVADLARVVDASRDGNDPAKVADDDVPPVSRVGLPDPEDVSLLADQDVDRLLRQLQDEGVPTRGVTSDPEEDANHE